MAEKSVRHLVPIYSLQPEDLLDEHPDWRIGRYAYQESPKSTVEVGDGEYSMVLEYEVNSEWMFVRARDIFEYFRVDTLYDDGGMMIRPMDELGRVQCRTCGHEIKHISMLSLAYAGAEHLEMYHAEEFFEARVREQVKRRFVGGSTSVNNV